MAIHTDTVTLVASDGTSMRAYVARPAGADAPRGLLLIQEAFGVNAHIRDLAGRFAGEGYSVIAPELFHRTAEPGFDGRYDDFPSVMPHMAALKDASMEGDFKASYDWLRANGVSGTAPVAAVGFCMGGRASFLAALSLPLHCAVSFYGGGIAPNQRNPGLLARVPDLNSPVLLFWGGRDKNIDASQANAVVQALRAADKDFVSVEFSAADHAFFCDARASYNPTAAAQAWPLTLAFLKVHTSAK